MEDRFRFLTTSIIWVAFAVVLVTLFIALAATNADMTEFQFLVLAAFVMFLTAIAGIQRSRSGVRRVAPMSRCGKTAGSQSGLMRLVFSGLLMKWMKTTSSNSKRCSVRGITIRWSSCRSGYI